MENIYIIAIYSILLLLYIEVKDYFLRKHINEKFENLYEKVKHINKCINEKFEGINKDI